MRFLVSSHRRSCLRQNGQSWSPRPPRFSVHAGNHQGKAQGFQCSFLFGGQDLVETPKRSETGYPSAASVAWSKCGSKCLNFSDKPSKCLVTDSLSMLFLLNDIFLSHSGYGWHFSIIFWRIHHDTSSFYGWRSSHRPRLDLNTSVGGFHRDAFVGTAVPHDWRESFSNHLW